MHDSSPYNKKDVPEWLEITKSLIDEHPLSAEQIVRICLKSWDQIFSSKIGGIIQIGEEIALTPQMIGNFLHVLIAHNLSVEESHLWRIEQTTEDKDIVYIPDNYYSFEMKSSSSKNDIYGNRSYGQLVTNGKGKKSKDGYYLAINFTKPMKGEKAEITKIKFGWLDHSDWIAQSAATGQQSRLTPEAKKFKLLTLYSPSSSQEMIIEDQN